jgi:hypothetical protein
MKKVHLTTDGVKDEVIRTDNLVLLSNVEGFSSENGGVVAFEKLITHPDHAIWLGTDYMLDSCTPEVVQTTTGDVVLIFRKK